MGCDLELVLQPEHGSTLPSDCYATVRPVDGDFKQLISPIAPMLLSLEEASRLGTVKAGSGPLVVDLFQRVGSITVNIVEPNLQYEANLMCPGHAELRVRLSLAQFATADLGSLLPTKTKEVHGETTPPKFAPEKVFPGSPPKSFAAPQNEINTKYFGEDVAKEAAVKHYKPIALTHCDQIIPNLYLGGCQAALDKQLVQQGFRAVCCCCRELELPSSDWQPDLEYYRVDVEDMSKEPIEYFFQEATEFIHNSVSRDQPILVHCRAGVSRSSTVVIAYLMEYQGLSLYDAFFLVRSHRSIVCPNIGFLEKLCDYEEGLTNTDTTIDVNKYIGWYDAPDRAAVPDLQPD